MSTVDIIFAAVVVGSMFSNFYGLPGNVIIALDSVVYGVITNFREIGFGFLLTLFLVVVLVEFLEYLLIVLTVRKMGGSNWGIVGSILGGIGGAISGAFFTPVMGAIIGSLLGVFIGATLFEFFKSFNLKTAFLGGVGAFLGRIGGLTIKTCGAVTLIIMIGYKIF